jgi:hypothetical protein
MFPSLRVHEELLRLARFAEAACVTAVNLDISFAHVISGGQPYHVIVSQILPSRTVR